MSIGGSAKPPKPPPPPELPPQLTDPEVQRAAMFARVGKWGGFAGTRVAGRRVRNSLSMRVLRPGQTGFGEKGGDNPLAAGGTSNVNRPATTGGSSNVVSITGERPPGSTGVSVNTSTGATRPPPARVVETPTPPRGSPTETVSTGGSAPRSGGTVSVNTSTGQPRAVVRPRRR